MINILFENLLNNLDVCTGKKTKNFVSSQTKCLSGISFMSLLGLLRRKEINVRAGALA